MAEPFFDFSYPTQRLKMIGAESRWQLVLYLSYGPSSILDSTPCPTMRKVTIRPLSYAGYKHVHVDLLVKNLLNYGCFKIIDYDGKDDGSQFQNKAFLNLLKGDIIWSRRDFGKTCNL